jgi:hypothetical protein
MQPSHHLHERIARATNRLAQLQAQELVTAQRQAMRARELARRSEMRRRRRVAELVFATGSQSLEDGEIVAAMLRYRDDCQEPGLRAQAIILGETYLSNLALGGAPKPH